MKQHCCTPVTVGCVRYCQTRPVKARSGMLNSNRYRRSVFESCTVAPSSSPYRYLPLGVAAIDSKPRLPATVAWAGDEMNGLLGDSRKPVSLIDPTRPAGTRNGGSSSTPVSSKWRIQGPNSSPIQRSPSLPRCSDSGSRSAPVRRRSAGLWMGKPMTPFGSLNWTKSSTTGRLLCRPWPS